MSKSSKATLPLQVMVNGTVMLTYDRSKPVPSEQENYLKNMDTRMDQGIELNGRVISRPAEKQRSQFVANEMINALFRKEQAMAVAMCTWLGVRVPSLTMVQASGDIRRDMRVDLTFNRSEKPGQTEPVVKLRQPAKV